METIFEATKQNCIYEQQDAAQSAKFAAERLALGWLNGAVEMQERAARDYRMMWLRLERLI